MTSFPKFIIRKFGWRWEIVETGLVNTVCWFIFDSIWCLYLTLATCATPAQVKMGNMMIFVTYLTIANQPQNMDFLCDRTIDSFKVGGLREPSPDTKKPLPSTKHPIKLTIHTIHFDERFVLHFCYIYLLSFHSCQHFLKVYFDTTHLELCSDFSKRLYRMIIWLRYIEVLSRLHVIYRNTFFLL